MAIWGRVQAFLTGAAVSRASSDAVGPVMEPVRQRSNQRNAVRVIDPGTIAELIARLIVDEPEGTAESLRSGVNENRLHALTLLAQTWPGLGELDRLSNRQLIGMDEVITALHRHGFPADLIGTAQNPGPLVKLFQDVLTPGELAAAIHRGLVPNDGLVLGEQPQPPFKVKAYPVYDRIDPVAEAQSSGYDRDRLGVLVGLQGLPMGVIEAAQSFWRKIITHGDYIRAFNTSNSRNEWAEAVLEYSRQIPTARDFLENALRGYRTLDDAIAGAHLHGMTPEHATLIYQNQGRPMNIRQITQALARGAKFHPEPGELTDPYEASTVEGPIKPAYYEMFKSLRYTLPSAFVMRQLAQSGVWSEAKTAERLKWSGWYPQDADEAAAAWSGGGGATADPRVKSAQTAAVAALHKQWMNEATDEAGVLNGLQQVNVSAADAQAILDYWIMERLFTEKPLTPAAIKKAYKGNELAIDDAVARLVAQQWSAADANIYLTS